VVRTLATLVLALLPVASAAAPPLCSVTAAVEPDHALVDQQVLHRLTIETRRDVDRVRWTNQPSFSDARIERLPGSPEAGRREQGGFELVRREEHRALYPERAGRFEIGSGRLRCAAGDEVVEVPVPPVRLEVSELPREARPADFSGVIGSVAVFARVDRDTVRLGESVRLDVTLQGGGNLWDAADLLPETDQLGTTRIFRQRPELDLDRGRRLIARKRFHYDLVPRETGRIDVPPLRIVFFDPDRRTYETAASAPLSVRVLEAAPSAPEAGTERPAATGDAGHAPSADADSAPLPAVAIGAALFAAAAAAGAVLLRARGAKPKSVALDELRRALGERDATRAARLAQRALEAELGAASSPDEALARGDLGPRARALAALWSRIERARFDPTAELPPSRAVDEIGADSIS
jgi:hypothetical protein